MGSDRLRADGDADEAERYLHAHIPISAALGIHVVHAGLDAVELGAGLAPNVNHRSTVFGGSSVSVAILAAWTLAQLHVGALAGTHRVVIAECRMAYLEPIDRDFTARCVSPGAATWERFVRVLERRGRAQVELAATVSSEGRRVARFTGVYAALRV
jgi:thioesterase domain-containing protein